MPAGVRRPREGIQPDTRPFEKLSKSRPSIKSDPMELMLVRMGEMSQITNGLEIECFREYVVFAMRGFGNFTPASGTWYMVRIWKLL